MYQETFRAYVRLARLRCDFGDPHFRVTPDVIRELRPREYIDQWRLARENRWYHVRFPDQSLMLFGLYPSPSFSFLDRPIDAKSIEDFLESRGLSVSSRSVRACEEEYSDYLSTVPLRRHWTPIRYDYDTKSYRSGVHPAAHLHIGLENDIRIGLRRELSPLAFFLFVVRQMYPASWERLLLQSDSARLPKRVRAELEEIGSPFFCEKDLSEMYLH